MGLRPIEGKHKLSGLPVRLPRMPSMSCLMIAEQSSGHRSLDDVVFTLARAKRKPRYDEFSAGCFES